MTALYILSDLHLDAAGFEPDYHALDACDAIVLAGDIHQGTDGVRWAADTFGDLDKPIIYVAGNHEFWGGRDFHTTIDDLRSVSKSVGVRFLENDWVDVKGIRIFGCTLWTDYAYFDTPELSMAKSRYNYIDFSEIRIDGERLHPEHVLRRHQESVAWLQSELMHWPQQRSVVVTHHFPCHQSCHTDFHDDKLTPCYGNRFDGAFMTQASLWIHGHTHRSSNYQMGDSAKQCRVVANPRGFPFWDGEWENKDFRDNLLVAPDDQGRWGVVG